jgi:hypothetical protein
MPLGDCTTTAAADASLHAAAHSVARPVLRPADPHNWRLCPYAHPGEAGRRRPPHMHQPVMCDFGKTVRVCMSAAATCSAAA